MEIDRMRKRGAEPDEVPYKKSGDLDDGDLDEYFRRFDFLAALRDRNQIRRVCAESLSLYHQLEVDLPQSSRMERYLQVVQSRRGAGRRSVAKILCLVREGFALWPMDRPLSLRDVVQYIAVTDCLRTETGAGPRDRDVGLVRDIVSELIPANL